MEKIKPSYAKEEHFKFLDDLKRKSMLFNPIIDLSNKFRLTQAMAKQVYLYWNYAYNTPWERFMEEEHIYFDEEENS